MSERPNAYDLEGIHRHVKKARAERKAIRPPFDVDKVAEEILRWFVQIDDPLRDRHHGREVRAILNRAINGEE